MSLKKAKAKSQEKTWRIILKNMVKNIGKRFKLNLRILYLSILIILVILTLYSVFTAVNYFIHPQNVTNRLQKSLNISYHYDIFPKISALYPNDDVPLQIGKKNYFTKITKRIDFNVIAEIFPENNNTVVSQDIMMDVKILIRSEDQWEKILDFKPEVSKVIFNDGKVIFKSVFTLPFNEANNIAEKIIEEIELAPSDGYGIIIQSNISGISGSKNSSAPDNYTGEYRLTIKQPGIIEPQKELIDQQIITISENEEINYLNFWGNPVKVSTGRLIFSGISCALVIAVFLIYFLLYRKILPKTLKPQIQFEFIRRKYGSRIVVTEKLKDLPPNIITVEILDFKELLKIASDTEKPILQLNVLDNNKNSVLFYIIDGNAFYFYQILM